MRACVLCCAQVSELDGQEMDKQGEIIAAQLARGKRRSPRAKRSASLIMWRSNRVKKKQQQHKSSDLFPSSSSLFSATKEIQFQGVRLPPITARSAQIAHLVQLRIQ